MRVKETGKHFEEARQDRSQERTVSFKVTPDGYLASGICGNAPLHPFGFPSCKKTLSDPFAGNPKSVKLCSCIHTGKLEGLIDPQPAGQLNPSSSTVNGPVTGAWAADIPAVPGVAVRKGPVATRRFSGGSSPVELPGNDGPPVALGADWVP